MVGDDFFYHITWYAENTTIHRETATAAFINKSWTPLLNVSRNIGNQVHCSVGVSKSSLEEPCTLFHSDVFFIGLQFLDTNLVLSRKGHGVIRFQFTIPYVTNTEFINGSAQPLAPLEIQSYSVSKSGTNCMGHIAFKYCSFPVNAYSFEDRSKYETDEWRNIQTLTVYHKDTEAYTIDNHVILSVKTRSKGNAIFDDLPIGNLSVTIIEDSEVWKGISCGSKTDPHLLTFNGISYENHLDGDFILYRNTRFNQAVLARHHQCHASFEFPHCTCAVAIQGGRDVFSIDICNDSQTIDFLVCDDKVLKVYKETDKIYKIMLPTGTSVGVSLVEWPVEGAWHIDLDIYPSLLDVHNTEGLCGTMDDTPENDLKRKDGTIDNSTLVYPNEFSRSWMVQDSENLLIPTTVALQSLESVSSTLNLTCTCININDCSYKTLSSCGEKGKEYRCLKQTEQLSRRKRFVFEKNSASSLLESKSGVKQIRSKRQTPTAVMSKSEAESICKSAFEQSEPYSTCQQYVRELSNASLTNCVMDIIMTGDENITSIHIEAALQQCVKFVSFNTTLQFTEPAISYQLKTLCSNNCSGHGFCNTGNCSCHNGFGGSDCSFSVLSPPRITNVSPKISCDRSSEACSEVLFDGRYFLENVQKTCFVTREMVEYDGSINSTILIEQPLDVRTLFQAACPLNYISSDTWIVRFLIKVSSDGNQFTDTFSINSYYSTCQRIEIDSSGVSFTLKENFCFINSTCIPKSTINPMKECEVCDPDQRKFGWSLRQATTPNPCVEYRVGRNLSEGCGNHSDSGYCVDDNSACMPSPEGTDWKCICVNGFFSFNSSCVPVPEPLFEDKNISLGMFTTDRIVSISKSNTKDSEHYFSFGDDVQAVDTNNGDCTLKTLESGFSCFLNDTGIIVKIDKLLEDKLYHVIAHVTVFIGPEKAKVEDTLGISFDIQTIRENQTIILPDGIMKDTLVSKVDLVPYEMTPLLFGDANYFHMDSNGFVRTNWTISLDDHDPKLISKLFITYAYTDRFIGIVVYKKKYEIDIKENTNETLICITAPNVDSTILQPHDFVALQSNGSVVVQKPFDYETIKEYKFSVFSQYNGQNFTTDVTLNVIDQNDVMPSFTSTTYNFKAIQSDFNTVVGVVSASDPDTVGSLEYNITGDSRFSISPSGVISLTNAQRNGNATITVSDGKLQDQAFVNVEVIPVVTNDTHSQFNFSCEILENQPTGTTVCNISLSGYTDYIFDFPDAQNFFNLNAEKGQISTNVKIDRETTPSFNYSVFAKEEKRSCKFASIQVQILVKDENDNPPLFERTKYVGTIKENSAIRTVVQLDHPISATDRDVNSAFTYNISGDAFDIDASTGEISSLKVLDREGKENYDLILGVFDGIHATTASVQISVADINDNPPILPNTTFTIPENASVDSNVGQLHATDADTGINAELFYRCDSEFFKINSTGMLKVGREVDRETIDHHVFNCSVCDNGKPSPLCATSEIQVVVTDINERPSKKNDGKVFSVPETSNCTSVWNMTSFFEDDDLGSNSELEFRILSHAEIFSVDSNGIVSCPSLDYEKVQKTYQVEIQATDKGSPKYSTTNTINILVEDVNDNTPIPSEDKDFEIIFYSGECTSGCSKLVALITASDADTGINAELIFQESGGNASAFLEVERETGLVSAKSQPSETGVYEYTVIISDKGTPSLNATTTISLNVTILQDTGSKIIKMFPTDKLVYNWTENVDFLAPFIYLKNFTSVETPSNVTFLTPNYIHSDFYLNGSQNEHLFVNATTLQRKQGNSATSFDREKLKQYRFIVQAKLPQYSMLAELIINILDVNDNPPEFISKTPRVVLIREDAKNGTMLSVNLDATDRDEGENAVIAYRISQEGCGGVFQLRNSKDIYLNGELDYEKIPFCSLNITVYNPNKVEMNSVTKVSIEIGDVNDNEPSFNSSVYHIAFNEIRTEDLKEKATLTVPQFSVVDEDSRQYGTKGLRLSFEEPSLCPVIVENDRADEFRLTVNKSMELDYETKKNYNCTLIAKDGGGKSSTALLVVELLDVNDNAPESDDVIQIEILRSINISHVIVDFINATDKDSGNNALIEFAFAETSGAYSFFAINSSSGEISIAKNLSKLQVDSAELYVIVSDKGNPPLSTTVTVKITIIDENRRPFFNQSAYQVEVEENTVLTGLLTTMTAEDWEKNETKICNCTYSFQRDDDSSFYTIKQRSGEIYVTSQNLRYDREARPVVSLTVIAEDEGGKQTRAEVRIIILDQNDNDPKFLEDFYQFEIYQEAFEGTYIGKVLAVDKDEGDNAITLYRITNESSIASNYNDSVFVINETTGELISNGSLNIGSVKDFEEIVTVEAFDKNDSLRTDRVRVSVIIKYNDTNQNPPVFNLSDSERSHTVSLTTTKEGSHIFQLTATDVDSGKDGQVVYSILDGNAFNMFQINSTGAISLRKKVKFVGDHTINLTVQAKDQGVNSKLGIVSLSLTLQGEDQCGPSTTGASAAEKQFQTYTWSLLGVTCLLILTTGIAICGWCRSRLNAKKASDIHDDNSEQARMFGLKLNPSYGAGLPQLGKFMDSQHDNQRRRYNYRIGSVGFESSTDEPDEFDRRGGFRQSMFDPGPPQAPPPLPKPRNSGAPFIPKPDYE